MTTNLNRTWKTKVSYIKFKPGWFYRNGGCPIIFQWQYDKLNFEKEFIRKMKVTENETD